MERLQKTSRRTTFPMEPCAVPKNPWKASVRLRIQTWQRHHGLSEPLRESDEGGENVHAGVAGESEQNLLCVSCVFSSPSSPLLPLSFPLRTVFACEEEKQSIQSAPLRVLLASPCRRGKLTAPPRSELGARWSPCACVKPFGCVWSGAHAPGVCAGLVLLVAGGSAVCARGASPVSEP